MNNNDALRNLEKDLKKLAVNALRKPIQGFTDLVSLILLTVFLSLKLTDVITWSWCWVLSPFWIALCWNIILHFAIVYYVNKKFK